MKYLMILLAFAISFSSALTADFDCPEEVHQNVEFTCNLEIVDAEGIYDFKLDLQKDSENIAKIYNADKDSFQSSFYYLKEFIEVGSEKDVRIIIEENGNLDGFLKLRKGGSTEEFNFSIRVLKSNAGEGDGVEENEIVEENSEETNNEIESNNSEMKSESIEVNNATTEVIVLSSQKENTEEEKVLVYESKNSKIIRFLPYAFSLFLIILIFFLVRDKV